MAGSIISERLDPLWIDPTLTIELDPGGAGWCVRAENLCPVFSAVLDGHMTSLLRVKVAETGGAVDDLPDISGDYEIAGDAVRFIPHLAFDCGVLFHAILDLRSLGRPGMAEVQTLEFSFPRGARTVETKVRDVFPSSDVLPANLLRFCVRFSGPMQRGRAQDNIQILSSDGEPAPDILYRAPVELWDRSMTCLTILLDPGRLKRSVGPNRILGPPLKAGRRYTLAIGTGMIDVHGRPLHEAFNKSFGVSEALRARFAIEDWTISAPAAGSRDSLKLTFPRPLDWAQLWHGITVASETGQSLGGSIAIGVGETQWQFIPEEAWQARAHSVRVAPGLEDICGNTLYGPFDAPIRSADEVALQTAIRTIPFVVKFPAHTVVPAAGK